MFEHALSTKNNRKNPRSGHKPTRIICLSVLFCIVSITLRAQENAATQNNSSTYSNPIINHDGPDPSVLKDKNGWFYLFSTGERIWKSKNMVDWMFVGNVFEKGKHPNFVPGVRSYWAPDINKIGKNYVLYYSLSKWGGEDSCGVGVAVSKLPEGPYTPVGDGKLFRSYEIGVRNSIDQFYIEDKGRKYLIWGSFHGIYAIELSKDGLSVKPGAEKVQIAGTAYEGSYVYKRHGYYYYFGSVGTCCDGLKSTYRTVYGRSKSLLGPYLTKNGERLLDNHYEVLIHGNHHFVGTGHNAEFVADKNGDTWIPYHAFRTDAQELGRVVLLDKVKWVDDWPCVEGDEPSDHAPRPRF